MSICAFENRGGDSPWIPTLHLGIGDCCDDPHVSGPFDGWN